MVREVMLTDHSQVKRLEEKLDFSPTLLLSPSSEIGRVTERQFQLEDKGSDDSVSVTVTFFRPTNSHH